MTTLQIDEKKARQLYKTASPEFKQMLSDTFGARFFSINIIERIDSFLAACKELDIDPNHPAFTTGDEDTIAYEMLKVIARALREGNVLDFNDGNQKKWRPWLQWSGSGFRFNGSYYAYSVTDAGGGSRLYVDTKEKSDHFGSHPEFLKLWNKLNPGKIY